MNRIHFENYYSFHTGYTFEDLFKTQFDRYCKNRTISEVEEIREEEVRIKLKLCTDKEKGRKKKTVLEQLGIALSGFKDAQDNATHFSFVSSKELDLVDVIDLRDLLPCGEETDCNLLQYKKKYSHIIMAVLSGKAKNDHNFYWNRGIHRLPYAIIEGGYPNIAIALHAFTTTLFKERDHLVVHPVGAMADILRKNLPEGFYNEIKSEFGTDEVRKHIENVPYHAYMTEPEFEINRENLENMFRTTYGGIEQVA